MLFTKFSKIHQKEPLLPIPMGFLHVKQPSSGTAQHLKSNVQRKQVSSLNMHKRETTDLDDLESEDISMPLAPGIVKVKTSKSRVDAFLSKKKIPGILEYLETKIYHKGLGKDKPSLKENQLLQHTLEYLEEERLPEAWLRSQQYYSLEFSPKEEQQPLTN